MTKWITVVCPKCGGAVWTIEGVAASSVGWHPHTLAQCEAYREAQRRVAEWKEQKAK